MAFQYLDESSIFDAFRDSESYMQVFFDPLDEFDRIARNKPHGSIRKPYPRVTDGTASSVVQKTPRRAIQQLPTGTVVSDINDDVGILATFFYLNEIIPNANMQFALLQKCWHVLKKSLTYGAAHAYVPMVKRGDYYGPDMLVPSIKDVLFEPGKVSDQDSNFVFMRGWYQPRDIDAIIAREKQLMARARERDQKYSPGWDLNVLESLKTEVTQKSENQMTEAEKKRQDQSQKGGIEIIHAFQRGIGGKFFSFHQKSKQVCRTKDNKDPRGEIPIITMYSDTDGSNPLGWGIIEQLAPLQNLMDSEMQMYQFNRALSLAPPIIKRGNWSKSQAKLVPNAIWDLGSEPNASADALKIDTSALQNFPEIYGLMKSQLLNLASSPDTSISSDVGNPGFSKTPAGVGQIQANVSIDDNYIRKQFETFFERWSETAINLYCAERTGIEEVQLDDKTANKLRQLDGFDERTLSSDNKMRINFSHVTERLRFEVDASTSNKQTNEQQIQTIDSLLERIDGSPILQSLVPREKIVAAWNTIVSASGIEDPEKLSITEEDMKNMDEKQAAEQQAQAQAQAPTATPPRAPSESLNYKDAPEDIKRQIEAQAGMQPSQMVSPVQQQADQRQQQLDQAAQKQVGTAMQMQHPAEMDPGANVEPEAEPQSEQSAADLSNEDIQFVAQLQELGYSDEQVAQALAMEQNGMSNEQIISMLEATE